MKQLPKVLYVKISGNGKEAWFSADTDRDSLVGNEAVEIGRYVLDDKAKFKNKVVKV